MTTKDKSIIVYIYILGSGNIYNGKNDAVSSLVPYKINEKELFFGPCKRKIREEIKKTYLKNLDYIYSNQLNSDIYLIGINPNIQGSGEIRQLLFGGKVQEIFTFKYAWEKYNKASKNINQVKKMIYGTKNILFGCGHEKKENLIDNKQEIQSPLHLKPIIKEKKYIGYEHRTKMHEKDWIRDILTDNEQIKLRRIKDVDLVIQQNKIKKQIDELQLDFGRDCCFSLENIFFSDKRDPHPIPLDDTFFTLIKNGLENPKGADLKSPFGYNKKGYKFGKMDVKLVGENGRKFIDHLYNKINENKGS